MAAGNFVLVSDAPEDTLLGSVWPAASELAPQSLFIGVNRGTVKIMVPFWVPIIIWGLIRGLI